MPLVLGPPVVILMTTSGGTFPPVRSMTLGGGNVVPPSCAPVPPCPPPPVPPGGIGPMPPLPVVMPPPVAPAPVPVLVAAPPAPPLPDGRSCVVSLEHAAASARPRPKRKYGAIARDGVLIAGLMANRDRCCSLRMRIDVVDDDGSIDPARRVRELNCRCTGWRRRS